MNIPKEPFLETKFSPPYLRPNAVHRSRLIEQLTLLPHTRLALISAPAGYGKTTLLSDWHIRLRAQGTAAAWVTLSEEDDHPAHFLSLVCTAFQLGLQGGVNESQKIANQIEILAASGFKDLAIGLAHLSGLLAQAQVPCVLILDDYHTITNSRAHDALAYLLDHLPLHVKLVIGSRSDPPLPLARLRARDELIEIRLADLRFTSEETEQFIHQTLRVPLQAAEIDQIARHVEGWAAGMQLIGLALRNWPDWAQRLLQPGESQQFISSYLAEEVFKKLEPGIQQFILKTSILDALSAPLCDAVCEADKMGFRSAEILAWLERENLFVIPLDPFGRQYRYHALFKEFLRARLERSAHSLADGDGELIASLHLRASRWYWKNDQGEQAVFHAIQAGNETWLVHLIEQAGLFMVARSELAMLHRWLASVREETLQSRPLLLITRAWEYLFQGQLELVEADLRRAEIIKGTLPEDFCIDLPGYRFTIQALTGYITTLRAFVARTRSQWELAIHLSEMALQQLPENDPSTRSTLAFNLAQVYKERHLVNLARPYYLQAIEFSRASGNAYIQLMSLAFLGQIAVLQGQMEAGEACYRRAMAQGYRADGNIAVPAVGYAEAWYGEWYLLQGQIPQAREHLERAVQLAELCDDYGIQQFSFLLMARVCLAAGSATGSAEDSAEAAMAWVEKAQRIPLDGIHSSRSWIEAHFGLLLLAQGRLQEAVRWAETVPILTDPNQVTRANEKISLSKLRVTLAGARQNLITPAALASSIQLLELLQTAAGQQGRTLSMVEILLIKAGLLILTGRSHAAQDALAEARRLADPCHWTQIFREIGMEIPAVSIEKGSTTQLLTERELELLRMAANGATNQEIAAHLCITVGTVKSHLNHIFSKLEARHRAEAIARARELGLI